MKRKAFLILPLFLFAMLSSMGQVSHEKWTKGIAKSERFYSQGLSFQAIRSAKKLQRYQEKEGYLPHLIPVTSALQAKYENAYGDAQGATATLEGLEENWRLSESKADSGVRIIANAYIADVFLSMNHTLKASEYLNKADTLLQASPKPNRMLEQQLRYKRLEVLIARHDLNDALELYKEVLKEQQAISKREQQIYHPETGESEIKKLKKKEYKTRRALIALLKAHEAEIYLMKGDYLAADSLLTNLEFVIDELVKRKHESQIRLKVSKAHVLEYLEEYKQAAKGYKKSKKMYAGRLKTSVPNAFYTALAEREINAYLEAGKERAAKKSINRYAREHLKRYGRNNTHFLETKRLKNKDEVANNKYVKALRRANRSIDDFSKFYPNIHSGKVPLLEQYKYLQIKNNNYSLAEAVNNQILIILDSLHGDSANIFLEAALEKAKLQTYFSFDFHSADSIYNRAFEAIVYNNLHPYHEDYLDQLEAYATLLIELDRFDSAQVIVNKSTKIAEAKFGSTSKEYAKQLKLLAETHILKGEFKEAEEALVKAVETIKDDKSKQTYVYYTTLITLGDIQQINGKYGDSQNTFKKAMRVGKKIGLNTDGLAAASSTEMAELLIETGRYEEAEELLTKNIDLLTKKHDANYYQLVEPYAALGSLQLINGNFIEAEKSVSNALRITELNVSDTGSKYIRDEILLGDIYFNMGDYERADKTYRAALDKNISTFGPQHIVTGDLLIKQARVMLATKVSTDTVMTLLERAANIIKSAVGDYHPKYAGAVELQAEVLLQDEQYDPALLKLEQAQAIYVRIYGTYHVRTVENRVRLGNLYFRKKEYATAEENYQLALKAFKKIFGDQHPDYTATLSKLGRCYYASGDYKSAMNTFDVTTTIYLEYIRKYFPSLTEQEKAKYWNKIRTDFEIFNSLAVTYHAEKPKLLSAMYDYKLATKALLLNSSMKVRKQIMASQDEGLMTLYNEWRVKREQLSASLSLSFDEQDMYGIYPGVLEKEIAILEKQLGERSTAFAENTKTTLYSWKDVKKTLKDNEAAIEIIRFHYYENAFTNSVVYAALVVTNETKKNPELVIIPGGNELEEKYFKYYRNVIKYRTKDKYSYARFWQPIEPALKNRTTVYLSADGVYNQLNPETFRKEDNTFLIDDYTFYSVSNTKDLVIKAESPAQPYLTKEVVMFGNPAFGSTGDSTLQANNASSNRISSVEPLPGAEEEVKTLRNILNENKWQTHMYLTTEATETEVKRMNNPRVVHVATHGFFVQEDQLEDVATENENMPVVNPLLKSGLLFAGADELLAEDNIFRVNKKEGVLTAYEAMNLTLDNTELVVLSACETGLGEVKSGEGVYGLQRSFLVAGAQNVIMTLFKVDDEVTQKLMTQFYSEWLATGDKRKAFIRAKQAIKKEYEHPIYWGSFVLIGLD